MNLALPFSTEAFYFRPFQEEDASFLFELNNDPEVIRWTGDPPFESVEAALQFILHYDHYEKYGIGRWCVVDTKTHEPLGWCGIKFHEKENFYDLGYRFAQKHWGKGLATASSKQCIQFAFEHLHLKELIGRVAIGNDASDRVLIKCGMTFQRLEECHHHQARIYSITQEQYSDSFTNR